MGPTITEYTVEEVPSNQYESLNSCRVIELQSLVEFSLYRTVQVELSKV